MNYFKFSALVYKTVNIYSTPIKRFLGSSIVSKDIKCFETKCMKTTGLTQVWTGHHVLSGDWWSSIENSMVGWLGWGAGGETEKCLDSGYILKVKLTNYWWTLCRFERKSQQVLLGFDLINQKDRTVIHCSEEDRGKQASGGRLGRSWGRSGTPCWTWLILDVCR